MRLDLLVALLRDHLADEHVLLRRVSRYILPLLLLPIGFALAQIPTGWPGLIAGSLGAIVLLVQIELFVRPTFTRAREIDRDLTLYLQLAPANAPQQPVLPFMIPSIAMLVLSMALFLPTILSDAAPWQRMAALAGGAIALWAIWQRMAEVILLLARVDARLSAANAAHPPREPQPAPMPRSRVRRIPDDGLLDPTITRRIVGLPLPPVPLSAAAVAMLRINAYLTLRDLPDTSDRTLIDAAADLGRRAYREEMRHYLLPPVGGKIYLPVSAGGTLAGLLGATARRLGMDGAYSATLGTWLVRLPPARSYRVAGQLIDALVALRLTPPGSVLPHHLTIQGDLGHGASLLSLLYLAASPILFAQRSDGDRGDERPFIMRGGGVLDRIDGRGRMKGSRTDFIDGFLFVQRPDMTGIEHLTGHTINLRVKQVLAYGLLAETSRTPPTAAAAYTRLRADLRALLARYDLAAALDADWIDGRWSDIWPALERMSAIKERDNTFLVAAQQLRDEALATIEGIALENSRELWRGIPAQD